jgi:hypothetical protein
VQFGSAIFIPAAIADMLSGHWMLPAGEFVGSDRAVSGALVPDIPAIDPC